MFNTLWDGVAQARGAFTKMEVIQQWTFLEAKAFVIVELNSVCLAQFFNQLGRNPSVVENWDSVKCSS